MRVVDTIEIDPRVKTLKIVYEGSGNPDDTHTIIGLALCDERGDWIHTISLHDLDLDILR